MFSRVQPCFKIISASFLICLTSCIMVIFMMVGWIAAKYMSSAPLLSGEMTLLAPERYNRLIFTFLLARVTIHISGCISRAVRVMKRLSTSSPVVIITPLARSIPASFIIFSSVASPGIARTSGSSQSSCSTIFSSFSMITTFWFLFNSSL